VNRGTITGRKDMTGDQITLTYDDKGIYHDGDPVTVCGVTHERVILARGNGGIVGSIKTEDYWKAKRDDVANETVAGALLAQIAYRREYEDASEDRLLEGARIISIQSGSYCGYKDECPNTTDAALITGLSRREGAYVMVPICTDCNIERLKKYNASLKAKEQQYS